MTANNPEAQTRNSYAIIGVGLGVVLIGIGSIMDGRTFDRASKKVDLLELQLAETRAAFTAFTNDYAQTHSQTNASPAYTDTNSEPRQTLSQRTPAEENYADQLNSTQAR